MRLRLIALLATLGLGCATTPATPAEPPLPPPPPPLAALSPEAAAFFARAEAPGPGAALTVDLDALQRLGLVGKTFTLHQLASVSAAVLSQLSSSDSPEAQAFARGAVVSALLREWAKWPNVRRFGFFVPSDRFLVGGERAVASSAVAALAVDGDSPDNAQLLAGVVALVRSVAEDMAREGAPVRVSLRGQDLCVEGATPEMPMCVRPQRGLILFGSPDALSGLAALPPPSAPAATAGQAPLLMGFRLNLGPKGRGRLSFTGRDSVRVVLELEGASPRDIGTVDAVVKRGLSEYDSHQEQVRQAVAAGLAEVQRSIAQDASAPASLKQAASALAAQGVVDDKGYWAQLRQSVQVVSTQDRFSMELTVPAGAVKELSDAIATGGSSMVLMGGMAAAAIPNFMKFTERSAQSEAKANLKSAFTGQRALFQEKDRWGRSFEEIGFSPEKGRRYTYCMGKQCLPCDKAGCKVSPSPSPCEGLTSVGQKPGEGFSICAYANLDSDDAWDVWVVDQYGEPQHLSNDTEE